MINQLFLALAPQADCYLVPGMDKERYGLMGARGTMSKGTTVTDRCAAACRPAALHRLPPPHQARPSPSTPPFLLPLNIKLSSHKN